MDSLNRYYLSSFLVLFFLILNLPVIQGQPKGPFNDNYTIDVWTTENGLPQNNIQAIVQTKKGYLWIGTEYGLVRFDGKSFYVFNKENTEEIKNDDVVYLYEDFIGNLWISTYGGGITRYKDGHFYSFSEKYGLDMNITGRIMVDNKGILWIGSRVGLIKFKNGHLKKYTEEDGLSNNVVTALIEGSDGNIWIGTYGGGLHLLKNGKLTNYSNKFIQSKAVIRCMYIDRNEYLWIGTYGDGLIRYKDGQFQSFSSKNGLSSDMVRCIYEDRRGNLWIGTNGGGLNLYKNGQFKVFSTDNGLTSDIIWCIYEDHEGSLWIGTKGGGLNRLKLAKFEVFTEKDGLADDFVRSVIESRSGDYWFGTNGGLSRYRNGRWKTYTTKSGLNNDFVRTIFEDSKGSLWVGTNGGLNFLKDGKWLNYTKEDGLSSNLINTIYEDRNGNIWIGTYGGGLNLFKDGKLVKPKRKRMIASNVIFSFIEVRKKLWIGTGHGLYCLEDGQLVEFACSDLIKNDTITSLFKDENNTLWIGTYGNGLKRMDSKERLTSYTTKEGLFNDNIYAILEDENNNLWLSSNQGIFSINKQIISEFDKNNIDALEYKYYDMSDGMKCNECNGMIQPAGWKTRDGKLLFPTLRGVVIIDPDNIEENKIPPRVILEKVVVDEKIVKPSLQNHFSPDHKMFSFYFTALSFLSPKKIKFKYILEGLDDDWTEITAPDNRFILYSNLRPGYYTFKVTACNDDGYWSKEDASFSFKLKKHFYMRGWFFLSIGLSLTFIGISSYKYKAYKKKSRIKNKYANSTLNPEKKKKYIRKLNHFMKKEKPYLNSNLTIRQLAKKLNIPQKHLSQIINENFNQNFNDFVNKYRIKEAKLQILNPGNNHLDLFSIAMEVGFNSKSSFNNAFKKHAGITPSEFRKINNPA